jgi:hypothetical protein
MQAVQETHATNVEEQEGAAKAIREQKHEGHDPIELRITTRGS